MTALPNFFQIQTIDGKITYMSQQSGGGGSAGRFLRQDSGNDVIGNKQQQQQPEIVFEPEAVTDEWVIIE